MGMEAGQTCLSPHPQDVNPPKATGHCSLWGNQVTDEKRPLGSFRQGKCFWPLPAPAPLGLCLVEPRGFLTLPRRQEAKRRAEKGGPGRG